MNAADEVAGVAVVPPGTEPGRGGAVAGVVAVGVGRVPGAALGTRVGRAEECGDDGVVHRVVHDPGAPTEVRRLVDGTLLQVGEHQRLGAEAAPGRAIRRRARASLRVVGDAQRERAGGARVVVGGQPDLLEVVGALDTAGGLARRLHRGQEQRNQHGDDGDDYEQLDQRETTPQTEIHLKAP